MAIKRILLPFCDAGGAQHLTQAAFLVGRLLSAQVHGLFAWPLHVALPVSDDSTTPDMFKRAVEKATAERAERLSEAQRIFRACAEQFPNVESEFESPEGEIDELVSHAARLADVSILGSGSNYAMNGWPKVRDAAIFGSGRPALVIPPAGLDERSFDRVVIAWKESIEAARAVAAAQPFLLHAKEVHLITVGEESDTVASLQDAEQYLQLHYAEVRSEIVPPSDQDVGEVLLSRSAAHGGALLVMGAYSHWRWRERVFGGVTEHVLDRAQTPVLMAH